MFYDLEYPRAFVADVSEALAEGGIWVIELHYLPTMLEAERFRCDRARTSRVLLARRDRAACSAREGLKVIAGQLNDINGGSIRLFIGHRGDHDQTAEQREQLQQLRIREFETRA